MCGIVSVAHIFMPTPKRILRATIFARQGVLPAFFYVRTTITTTLAYRGRARTRIDSTLEGIKKMYPITPLFQL